MNAYNRKMKGVHSSLHYEKRKEERQKMLDSMSDEERKSFFENEEKKRSEAREILVGTAAIFASMGIDCKYYF